jgi:hypothetical protein
MADNGNGSNKGRIEQITGVVVDVVFEDGVLYLELTNLADRPALDVTCTFDPTLVDAQGRDVSKLALFRGVEFLGPRRRIRTLLDSSAGYFAREAAARVTVAVEYERYGGPRRTTEVRHDLEVFRELAHLA